jgi:hypothetical protein
VEDKKEILYMAIAKIPPEDFEGIEIIDPRTPVDSPNDKCGGVLIRVFITSLPFREMNRVISSSVIPITLLRIQE